MPVHLDSHEPEVDLTPGTAKSDVVAFLYRNPEYGFGPAEVRDRLGIPDGTATATLSRLYDDGYVGRTEDGYYHALDRREDLRRYVASLGQLERMFEERGADEGGVERTLTAVDEEELAAEVDELEAEFEG